MVIVKTYQSGVGISALQRRQYLLLPLIFCILFAVCPAYCSTYFVATDGNDTNIGDINHPFLTIPKGVSSAVAGDTIYLRGGQYNYADKVSISKSGTSGNLITMQNYQNETAIVDFNNEPYGSSYRGISLSGNYWHFKGLTIRRAGDNGLYISGSNNIIEFCAIYENCDSGLQLGGGAANNQIINCDSYYNYDYLSTTPGGNADGFSPKMDVGTGNYFYGCRSWQNSDDAYDGYLRPSDDVTTTYENCWAFKSGYLKNGSVCPGGNGNGFKMGGSDDKLLRHNVILKNCLSFQNKAKGFDQNNDKGSMTLYNCTAFNNGGNNFSIATSPLASGKTAKVTNGVYFTGGISLGSFVVQTTNSWQSPFVVTSADFVSIDPSAAYGPRKADGSLPDITFMHLAVGSDLIDGGTDVNLPYCGTKPDLGCFENCQGGSEQRSLTISTSSGGTVTTPGIGTYWYNIGTDANIVASANANYHFVNWTGTAVTAGKVSNPNSSSTTVLMDANYTVAANFTIDQKTISGHVTEPDANIPVTGVSIAATNGGGSDTTDANGYYHLTVNYGWSGTVTPSKTGYTFEPNSTVYNNVTANQHTDYTAILDTFIISGYAVNSALAPLGGVLAAPDNSGGSYTSKYYGGGSDITDVNGYYEVLVDHNWSGKVVPSKYAYAFEPNSIAYTNVTANIADQNYVGTLLTYKITGYIKNSCEVPIKNVYVESNNGGSSYTTDVNGYYEVWVDYNWSGTVTPSKANYTFEPTSSSYTNVLENQTDQNYAATNIYDLDCSGYIGFGDVRIISDNWLGNGPGDFNGDDIVNFLDFADFAAVWLEE